MTLFTRNFYSYQQLDICIYPSEKIIEQQTKAWRLKCCFKTRAQQGREKFLVVERDKSSVAALEQRLGDVAMREAEKENVGAPRA